MEIHFTKKSAKLMCPDAKCLRSFGDLGRIILRRIRELKAAKCLEDMRHAPGWHEELTENRKMQLSCRLDANNRLIYRPHGDTGVYIENNGLIWKKVTEVEIIEVVDYH